MLIWRSKKSIKMKYVYSKIILALGISLFFSCQNLISTDVGSDIETPKSLEDQFLRLPEFLHVYNPTSTDDCISSNGIFEEGDLHILIHLNVSCVNCLEELELWQKGVEEFLSMNVAIHFVCRANDDFNLFKFIVESENIILPEAKFYFDTYDEFEGLNSELIQKGTVGVFLLGQSMNIVAKGNPVRDPKIREAYLQKIKNFTLL